MVNGSTPRVFKLTKTKKYLEIYLPIGPRSTLDFVGPPAILFPAQEPTAPAMPTPPKVQTIYPPLSDKARAALAKSTLGKKYLAAQEVKKGANGGQPKAS